MGTKIVKGDALSGKANFFKISFIILLCLMQGARNCSASRINDADVEEGRRASSSTGSVLFPQTSDPSELFKVDESLLEEVPHKAASTHFKNVKLMIRFFHDIDYQGKVRAQLAKKDGNINTYITQLVAESWSSQFELHAYLFGLYKKTTGLQKIISEFQGRLSTQQEQIEGLSEENITLKARIRELEESNRAPSFWEWFFGFFRR